MNVKLEAEKILAFLRLWSPPSQLFSTHLLHAFRTEPVSSVPPICHILKTVTPSAKASHQSTRPLVSLIPNIPEKREQQGKMLFFNEVTQMKSPREVFPSYSQVWPGVQ